MMERKRKLLVVGATGSIGRHVVAVACASGYSVRALVREPGDAPDFPPDAELFRGDLTQPRTFGTALEGVDFVIFTHGTYNNPRAAEQVDYGAVQNVLMALQGRPVRVALMSTLGATDRKGSHDWKRRGERLLRASGLDYTIIRPGWFDYNAANQHRLVMLQGDTRLTGTPRDGVIARRQVAGALVRSLSSRAACRKTLELHADVGEQQDDWDPLFDALDKDPAGALDGVHDLANMPIDQEPAAIRQELTAAQRLIGLLPK